jgi:Lrp/AsnC family transcriptional regulator, leucine-responsive regulatory protein
MEKLDNTDRAILGILKKNARIGTKQVADQIGLTTTPTFERIKRLERIGVITGYTLSTDRKKIGRGLCIFCYVTLKEHNLELLKQFEERVAELAQVEQCFHVAGDHDYVLFISVPDMEAYEHFLKNQLTAIPSISNVHSTFVLSEIPTVY